MKTTTTNTTTYQNLGLYEGLQLALNGECLVSNPSAGESLMPSGPDWGWKVINSRGCGNQGLSITVPVSRRARELYLSAYADILAAQSGVDARLVRAMLRAKCPHKFECVESALDLLKGAMIQPHLIPAIMGWAGGVSGKGRWQRHYGLLAAQVEDYLLGTWPRKHAQITMAQAALELLGHTKKDAEDTVYSVFIPASK